MAFSRNFLSRRKINNQVPILSLKDNQFDKKFIDGLCNIGFVQITDHEINIKYYELLNFYNFDLNNKKSKKYGNWFNSTKEAPKEGIEWKDKLLIDKNNYSTEENKWLTEMSLYQEMIEKLSKRLLNIIAKELNLGINFDEQYSSTLRLLRYDKLSKNNKILRCEANTD